MPVALLLQTPPLVALESVVVAPTLTDEAPVMEPALGAAFTVTPLVATAVPHPLVTE
jgi:hypothetical protein